MRILVINVGSSSVKFSVFDLETGQQRLKNEFSFAAEGIEPTLQRIPAVLEQAGETRIDAVGHRVAHGGGHFREATRIDEDVLAAIAEFSSLAPLHNLPALSGIRVARAGWPNAPQVAVFDTAFHSGMPPYATTYAVPQSWRDAGLRRYGFHGTSHKYVMERVAQALDASPTDLRIISCHLGNGASLCAIDRGVSVDTSMGMTSLEGLVMGTRSGDVDPGAFGYLHRRFGLSSEAIESALYHDGGLAALSGATETFTLGVQAPVRISGDTKATPMITLEGPAGRLRTDGLIVAQRHIHMHPDKARRFNLKDRDLVEVEIDSIPRTTVFRDVMIRVSPDFRLEMHIDTDEANAASAPHGGEGELMATPCHATVTKCRPTTGRGCGTHQTEANP